MTPARGQTVLVRNEPGVMCANSGTNDGDDEVCYLMQRAAGKKPPCLITGISEMHANKMM